MYQKTNFLQQINLLLTGQYSAVNLRDFEIGQNFGLTGSGQAIGLRIPDENNIAVAPALEAGATLMTAAILAGFCITLFDLDKKVYTINNLPLSALVITGNTEIKSGSYYKINCNIDWSKSRINVCSPPALLAPGLFYLLPIQVYFKP
jgi:hypothetical protein